MAEVIFKPTKYPRYYVDSLGSVWSCKQTRWKKLSEAPGRNKNYNKVHLKTSFYEGAVDIHRLMMLSFFGEPPRDKPWVCHKNGNSKDNRIGNLYWGGPPENSADRVRHGRSMRGNECPTSKMTEEVAIKVKKALKSPSYKNNVSIARELGITVAMVEGIKYGKSWKHVK